jgi:hypothetical protein
MSFILTLVLSQLLLLGAPPEPWAVSAVKPDEFSRKPALRGVARIHSVVSH